MKTFRDLKMLMLKMGFQSIDGRTNWFKTNKRPKTKIYREGVEFEIDGFIQYADGDTIIGWI